MNDFNNYRGSILNKNGDFINYNIVPGLMHQDIVDDYCNSNNLNSINEDAIVQNGDIYIFVTLGIKCLLFICQKI